MTIKHALMTMAAPLALMATPAEAAFYTYDLTGAFTASFRIDAGEFASPTVEDDYFEVNGTGTIDGRTGSHIITFNTAAFDGGLTLGDNFTNLWGPQLFAGTTAMPRPLTGMFTLLIENDPDRVVTLNVAAVPEPATWAMMIGGFGAVGAAMRRRTTTRVTFA